ncbi:MAG TPA: glycosyltransferase [Candidatus Binatia bacterium]|nr:glycosyltransferase [Candidatus Binatia bacterium]
MNVSVIIPTYNRGHVVGEALASVLGQTWERFEVIVADDGSTDDTPDRLAAVKDPRVRYLRLDHHGIAATRNAAVAASRGDVLAFLDSDDYWRPEKLATDMAFLSRHPEVPAVFSDLEKYDGDVLVPSFMRATPVFSRRLPPERLPDAIVLDQREMLLCLLQESPILPSALAVRRGAFEQAGWFDPTWPTFSDWEFLVRFAGRFAFGYVDRALTVLRISRDSEHRVHSERGRRAMLRLLSRELRTHRRDPEARAAIRAGLHRLRVQLGWYYAERGRRGAALRNHLAGFVQLGKPDLLARAALVWAPRDLARRLKRRRAA